MQQPPTLPFPRKWCLDRALPSSHTWQTLTLSSTTFRSEGEAVGEAPSVVVERAKVIAPPPLPSSKSRPALLESMASTPPLYLCGWGSGVTAWSVSATSAAATNWREALQVAGGRSVASQTPPPTLTSPLSNHLYTRYTGLGRRLQSLLSQGSALFTRTPSTTSGPPSSNASTETSSSTTSSRPYSHHHALPYLLLLVVKTKARSQAPLVCSRGGVLLSRARHPGLPTL